ncbi:MAG: insulinase family protein [Candidatus Omnitrophica bacterium]|nr:insulinase family protein [Candidatus Omnitrophota bacterium]
MGIAFYRTVIFGFFIWAALFSAAFADPLQKYILNHGLTVLIDPMPSSETVAFQILVKTGSATEARFLGSGISHFVEHIVFKGTKTRGVGSASQEIQAAGGQINAATGKDYTNFTVTVPQEKYAVGLDVIADLVMNATIDPVEVEKEREVILNEMRLHNDDPESVLYDSAGANIFLAHPYRHPIIGYESLFRKISRDDLLAYYRERYTPGNMILAVAGRVDGDKILSLIKDTFKNFERGAAIVRAENDEPFPQSVRRVDRLFPTEISRVNLAFAGVKLLDPDLFALDLLAGILGQGRSSRLFLELYAKRHLVYSISAGNNTPVDRGAFEIYMNLEPAQTNEALRRVRETISALKREGVSEEELEKVKRQVLVEHIFGQQTAAGRAAAMAVDEAMTGDPDFGQHYTEAVKKVTRTDIKRAAEKYLNTDKMSVTVLAPLANAASKSDWGDQTVADFQKEVLPNGLTILIKEDHRLPITGMRLLMQAGLRAESKELNGISQLMALLWPKATDKFSVKALDAFIDSRGIDLSGFSGNNSMGLTVECLKADWSSAYDIFANLARRPAFPAEEMLKIRADMKAAIRQRDDDIAQRSILELRKILYPDSPLGLDPLGTPESLDRITRESLLALYRQYASPDNMVLVVYGDIQAKEVRQRLEKDFGAWRKKGSKKRILFGAVLETRREKEIRLPKQQAMVAVGFRGSTFYDADRYAAEVMAEILAAPFEGRLFREIREKQGLAYSVGGGLTPGIEPGIIIFYALTAEAKQAAVKQGLLDEARKITQELVDAKELTRIKEYLKGSQQIALETTGAKSFNAGLDELYGLGYKNHQEYARRIDAVTAADVQAAAKKYLNPDQMAVVITRPQ